MASRASKFAAEKFTLGQRIREKEINGVPGRTGTVIKENYSAPNQLFDGLKMEFIGIQIDGFGRPFMKCLACNWEAV